MTGNRRSNFLSRHAVPTILVAVAFIAAAFLLPTALRPPPDTANASGALNPNAPPQDNVQFVEASQEAAGGGAGSATGGATTTTTTEATSVANATTPTSLPPARGYCYGNPPRQIPSVYSGPCVPAWHGDNGGATWKNVFPNEIRIDIQGTGAPPTGRLPEASSDDPSTGNDTKTWQALEEYFNRHMEFYNRHIKFYGLAKPPDDTAASNDASATIAADQDQAFIMHNTIVGVCEPFVRKSLIAICDPLSRADNEAYAPGMYSPFMDLNEGIGFGSEFVCKTLMGQNTKFGGADVDGKPRKYGYLGYLSSKGGIDAQVFKDAFAHECNGDVEVATLSSDSDAQGAAAAVTKFKTDGVTSIIFYNQGVNMLAAMQQADNLAYNPEWVMIGAYAVDSNIVGELLPPHQAAHLFGLSTSQEWPKPNQTRECFLAVREIDPSLAASTGICNQWWMQLVTQMSGIQGAGPHLTPQTFQQGMFGLGHRFGQSNWNLGGGFGPGDKGYTDDVAIVWWSSTAHDETDNSVGAYVWTHGGHRFQRGQLPQGDGELFTAGSSVAPGP